MDTTTAAHVVTLARAFSAAVDHMITRPPVGVWVRYVGTHGVVGSAWCPSVAERRWCCDRAGHVYRHVLGREHRAAWWGVDAYAVYEAEQAIRAGATRVPAPGSSRWPGDPADWDCWTEAERRRFLREVDGLLVQAVAGAASSGLIAVVSPAGVCGCKLAHTMGM